MDSLDHAESDPISNLDNGVVSILVDKKSPGLMGFSSEAFDLFGSAKGDPRSKSMDEFMLLKAGGLFLG